MKKKAKKLPRFHVLKIEPTPERIGKLPSWAQQYIFYLAVRADPAAIFESRPLSAESDALIRMIAELKQEIGRLRRKLDKSG